MNFGTGAVKITPAHDPNDFEVGVRHNLESINILNENGTLHAAAGPEYAGMLRYDAREKILAQLTERGLFRVCHSNQFNSLGRST